MLSTLHGNHRLQYKPHGGSGYRLRLLCQWILQFFKYRLRLAERRWLWSSAGCVVDALELLEVLVIKVEAIWFTQRCCDDPLRLQWSEKKRRIHRLWGGLSESRSGEKRRDDSLFLHNKSYTRRPPNTKRHSWRTAVYTNCNMVIYIYIIFCRSTEIRHTSKGFSYPRFSATI